jgi:hypothetical protein
MMTTDVAFAAYLRALNAYAQASAVATRTNDVRHYKHARILKEIAHEKFVAWRAEAALQRALEQQRAHP